MSAEAGNLWGLNSWKFNGLVGRNALDVNVQKTGSKQTIVVTTSHSNSSAARRPGSQLVKNGIRKQTKKGLAQVAAATQGSFYRSDLKELAAQKYGKVQTSLRKKKGAVKSRRISK